MKKELSQTVDEIALHLIDLATYNWAYAPDEYPKEDRVNWDDEFEKMLSSIDILLSRCRGKNRKRYLEFALMELRLAKQSFIENDKSAGRRQLDALTEYLNDYRSGKKAKVDFIVSLDGQTETNKG